MLESAMVSRREFLVASAAVAAAPAQQAARPNAIVIVLDDLGVTDLGCLGASDLKTPNIDALAGSGARFINWYSNAPVCAPARSSILTGMYPARAGVPTNGKEIPPSRRTLASRMKAAGYATGCIGKWHLGSSADTVPNAHGFDYFYGFLGGCVDFYSHRNYWGEPRRVNYHDLWRNRGEIFEDGQYLTGRIAEETTAFIGKHASRPFFLYVAFNGPHYPMHAPDKYKQRFPNVEFERQTYAAMISAVDDGVGAIRKALQDAGVLDNTIITLVGDNGATTEARAGLDQKPATAGSNKPYRGFKFSCFDGGMHVPGMISWPARIPKGQVVKEIAMSMDILPTICKAVGADASGVDGSDILAVAASGAPSPHKAIFWDQNQQLAVRRGKWKLVIGGKTYDGTPEGRKALTGEDALFLSDLEIDPGETTNRRHEHPKLVDELSTLARKWQQEVTED